MGKSTQKHLTGRHFSKLKESDAYKEGVSTESSTPVSADEEALAALAKKIQRKKLAKKEKEREGRHLPVNRTHPSDI